MDNKELLEAIRGIVKEEVTPIIASQEEHTQILRALEDRTKVTQAEVENLKHDVAETQGTIKRIEESVEKLVAKQDFLEDATANNWNQIREIKKKQA